MNATKCDYGSCVLYCSRMSIEWMLLNENTCSELVAICFKIMVSDDDVCERKAALRRTIADRLAVLSKEEVRRQSDVVVGRLLAHSAYAAAHNVSVYLATDGEIDTDQIVRHAIDGGESML